MLWLWRYSGTAPHEDAALDEGGSNDHRHSEGSFEGLDDYPMGDIYEASEGAEESEAMESLRFNSLAEDGFVHNKAGDIASSQRKHSVGVDNNPLKRSKPKGSKDPYAVKDAIEEDQLGEDGGTYVLGTRQPALTQVHPVHTEMVDDNTMERPEVGIIGNIGASNIGSDMMEEVQPTLFSDD